jgi:ElaB/YqjD/DUF883 family membrane-anchored ribosome-binding protein
MNPSVDESRRKLVADFNAVIADTELLLKALAASGAEKGSELRTSAEQNLEVARQRLRELQGEAAQRSREAAKAADEYVHDNPWQAIGVIAAVAALAGFVVGLLLNRR